MRDPFPVIFTINHHHMLRLGFSGLNHLLCELCSVNIFGFYYCCVQEECRYRGLHIQCARYTRGLWPLTQNSPNPIPATAAHPLDHPSHDWLRTYRTEAANDLVKLHCCACNGSLIGFIYTCYQCNVSLHLDCFNLPIAIGHPLDDHPLLLQFPSRATYPHVPNPLCTACSLRLTGYSYVCMRCNVQFHHLCASFPTVIPSHPLTHQHPVNLSTVPWTFTCSACGMRFGELQWSYVCQERDCQRFTAHLHCVSALPLSLDLDI